MGNGSGNAKISLERTSEWGKTVKKKSLFETIPVLLLLGLLAGAVGGLGIGMIQMRAAASASAAAAGK